MSCMDFITIWFFSYLSSSAHLSICILPGLLPLGHKLQWSRNNVPLSLLHFCVLSFGFTDSKLVKIYVNEYMEDSQIAPGKKFPVSWPGPLPYPLSSSFPPRKVPFMAQMSWLDFSSGKQYNWLFPSGLYYVTIISMLTCILFPLSEF